MQVPKAGLLGVLVCLVALLAAFPASLQAQTGTVVGTVSDPTGAVVPDAEVELTNPATNIGFTTRTNAAGHYTFPTVPLGTYRLTVRAPGFRTAVLSLKVEVAKSVLGDVSLEVGAVAETVEVTAGARATLQTVDAQVGETLREADVLRLPTVQRRASELIYLQVATTPIAGIGAALGGSVAGGRPDQNSATLDGVLVTDLVVGGEIGGNISNMPLPVEALEEFTGTVSNPMDVRSAGGAFSFATRRGTNDWHGSAYWYHQNDQANANSWTRNRLKQKNPELKDNRFGFRAGGPIVKDKAFFHLFYEGRRFPQRTDASRIGISETMRAGILRFRDAAGNVVSYNLATSTLCGPSGGLPCDPRGLGLNPVIAQYFTLYPVANDPSSGDGLNTIGIRDSIDVSSRSDNAVIRVDFNVTSKWRVFANYFYQLQRTGDTTQIDFNPAVTGGRLLKSTAGIPLDPDFYAVGVTGQLKPNLTYEFRYGFNKQDIDFTRVLQSILVPAAGSALDLAGTPPTGFLDDPGDPTVGRARPLWTDTKIRQFANNLTWVKRSHVASFTANYQHLRSRHARFDRIPLRIIPTADITANIFRTISADNRPPTCSTTITTNCLQSGDIARWEALYASILGIWDSTQTFYVRDSAGNWLGVVPIDNDDKWHHVEISGGDSWRVSPSLTLTASVNFMVETPLREVNGKQAFIVDANTGELIRARELLPTKVAAAKQGLPFNQRMAWVPRETLNREFYPTIFEVLPRVAVAWNPSFREGFLGRLFGDRKTVLRGGYSFQTDSVLTVWPQVASFIGNQLMGDSFAIIAPRCDRSGTPGPGCNPTSTNTGLSAFRIGVDGTGAVPPAGPFSIPFVPPARNVATGQPFGVIGPLWNDPDFDVGRVHGGNLTWQREVPGDVIVELGWIGRWGRRLTGLANINAVPFMIRDMTGLSNQTFAEAFDRLARELRAGVAPASVSPQPWFENLFGAGGTASIAAAASGNIIAGRISRLFLNTIDPRLQLLGLPTVLNQQLDFAAWHVNDRFSNYHAFFTSIRKRPSRGLSLVFNWTWAHCLDTAGGVEDGGGGGTINSFDPAFDYGSCRFDRRHVVQSYGTYDLPFRKSSRLVGGWYLSYIFTAFSGLPLSISASGDGYGIGALFGITESVPAITTPPERKTSVHRGVTGSGGVGTAGSPAAGGTGLNLFSDPEAVFKSLRHFLLSQDTRNNRGLFRSLGYWNLDFSLGKRTPVTESVNITLSFDFFNIFNHPNFNASPSAFGLPVSILSPSTFGVITSQATGLPILGDINVGPRRLQFGFRLEF